MVRHRGSRRRMKTFKLTYEDHPSSNTTIRAKSKEEAFEKAPSVPFQMCHVEEVK